MPAIIFLLCRTSC